MKYAVVILAIVGAASAASQFGRQPFQPFQFSTTPAPFRYRPVTPTAAPIFIAPVPPTPFQVSPVVRPAVRVSEESLAQTLKSENEINPDGSFSYLYETNNGITAQARGIPRTFPGNPPVSPVVFDGAFSWPNPQGGEPIVITYVADENGYRPSGNALPTPPPLPPQIARALAYTLNKA